MTGLPLKLWSLEMPRMPETHPGGKPVLGERIERIGRDYPTDSH